MVKLGIVKQAEGMRDSLDNIIHFVQDYLAIIVFLCCPHNHTSCVKNGSQTILTEEYQSI